MSKTISIVTPVFNEAENIRLFEAEIDKVFKALTYYEYELFFVNDGSSDNSQTEIELLAVSNSRVRYLEFTRNFGKEAAITAGLKHVGGQAVIVIDSDLQHPPSLIPEFIKHWETGVPMVVGLRTANESSGFLRRLSSFFFYKLIGLISDTAMLEKSTDFRLLDRRVIEEFNRLTEHERLARGLFDWLGFPYAIVPFRAAPRRFGKPAYSMVKLFHLALATFTSHSLLPLKFAGVVGFSIVAFSGPLGLFIFIDKYVLADPFGFNFSGIAILAVLNLFLVGLVLLSLGFIAIYIGNIYGEVINRPLFVINRRKLE